MKLTSEQIFKLSLASFIFSGFLLYWSRKLEKESKIAMIQEHERLISVLKSGEESALKQELAIQEQELEEYQKLV